MDRGLKEGTHSRKD